MGITVEAIYENGVLKPTQPLPLKEYERVRLTIQANDNLQPAPESGSQGYGLIPWTGAIEDLDYLIDDIANDPLERP